MFGFDERQARVATCYLRKGQVYLHASSRTVDGFYVATPPFLVVDLANSRKVEASITSALAGSKAKVPTPPRDVELLSALYELAGVKTWGSFVRGAKMTHLYQLETTLRFRPTRNFGARNGFEEIAEAVFETSPHESSSSALVRAFELSR